ncbi:MAG: deoxyhypusine synthase family protein [Candidatus Micrarchaeota archaeon]
MAKKLKLKTVNPVSVKKGMTADQLVRQFGGSGVMGAGKLAQAVDILEIMVKDRDCKMFMGVAGALMPGGMREVITDFAKNKWCDALVLTGSVITHDLIESLGQRHYIGSEMMDDRKLQKLGYDRMYNSLMHNEVYTVLEKEVKKIIGKIGAQKLSISQFLALVGKYSSKPNLLKTCYEKGIPVFCPAIQDCGFGIMSHFYAKQSGLSVGTFDDLDEIFDIAWTAKRKGYFYVGGGVPKNFIQQAFQFGPNPGDYGVQLTMDRPEPGGSSGAPPHEGISWGKLKTDAKHVNVICDATIALPIIDACLKERVR